MPRDTRTFPRGVLGVLCTASILAIIPGCNILGPALMIVAPDPSVEKQFSLDPQRPTVVFIDDRASRLPRRSLRNVIADEVQTLLLSEGKHKNIIDAKAAFAAVAGEKAGEPMTITEIGAASEAEIVVYVTIDSFSLSPDGQTYQPAAALRVKVIDAAADTRIWPPEAEMPDGYKLNVTRPQKAAFNPGTRSELARAQTDAAKYVGKAIAQTFYTHRVDQSAAAGR